MLGPKEDNVMLEDKDRLLPSRILEAGWKKKIHKGTRHQESAATCQIISIKINKKKKGVYKLQQTENTSWRGQISLK